MIIISWSNYTIILINIIYNKNVQHSWGRGSKVLELLGTDFIFF